MTLSYDDSASRHSLQASAPPFNSGSPFGGPTPRVTGSERQLTLDELDIEDRTFRYTTRSDNRELEASLRIEGQKQAILVLSGAPHRIVDGFRRVEALRALGKTQVRAEICHVEDLEEAHRVAFRRNVVERDLGPIERAKAIRAARSAGRSLHGIAADFELSVKQIRRYLALLDLPAELAKLVERDEISMAHARILGAAEPDDLDGWVRTCKRMGWSSIRLREELERARVKNQGPQSVYVQQVGDELRVHGFTIDASVNAEERRMLREQLLRAVSFLEDNPSGTD